MRPSKTAQKASKMPLKRGSKPAKKKPSYTDYSRQVSENEVHMLAWQWVCEAYPDLLIFHVPNGGNRNLAEALKFKRMGVLPGVADFLMFAEADIAIELKDKGGDQSKAQKKFQKKWEALGKTYTIARSLEEFKEIINRHMPPPMPWEVK